MPKSPSQVVEIVMNSEDEAPPKSKKRNAKVVEANSEEEQASKSKKRNAKVVEANSEEEQASQSKKKDDEVVEAGDDEEDEDDEEEYEIEAILEAKVGAFGGGKMGYLVKWKGYGDEHNSWVVEEDAGNAQDLITEFWEQRKRDKKSQSQSRTSARGRGRKSEPVEHSQDPEDAPSSNKRRRNAQSAKSKSAAEDRQEGKSESDAEKPQAKKAKITYLAKDARDKEKASVPSPKEPKEPKEQNGLKEEDEDVTEAAHYVPIDSKTRERKSWESLVQSIDTVERIDGELKVFFTLKNGGKIVEPARECAKHFPQKLIVFYEANLRWRELDTSLETP